MAETVRSPRAYRTANGIQFFIEIIQSHLGSDTNIAFRHSRMILFGDSALGV